MHQQAYLNEHAICEFAKILLELYLVDAFEVSLHMVQPISLIIGQPLQLFVLFALHIIAGLLLSLCFNVGVALDEIGDDVLCFRLWIQT